ncbi:hypothetical protein DB346_14900 [Verrucomicrobia bacterium LW23]|nr:hypothetical protein DB346_14900 [Verrucomicrobia bacterium LW23]
MYTRPTPMKFLTIGNSLSNDAMTYFPAMARAAGHELVHYGANIGGWSLEQHAAGLIACEEAEAAGQPAPPSACGYGTEFSPPRAGFGTGGAAGASPTQISLLQALRAERWDVVSFQQVTGMSFRSETYEPWTTQLVDAVRRHTPATRLLAYQIWPYREDCPFANYAPGMTQQSMYEGIRDACAGIATTHGMDTVPAGLAFQIARATPPWVFSFPDPAFDYAAENPTAAPRQPGSLNIGWFVAEVIPPAASEPASPAPFRQLALDYKHANPAGKYLAGAVFFETLFGASAETITYVPPELTPVQCASLRAIAHQACTRFAAAERVAAAL